MSSGYVNVFPRIKAGTSRSTGTSSTIISARRRQASTSQVTLSLAGTARALFLSPQNPVCPRIGSSRRRISLIIGPRPPSTTSSAKRHINVGRRMVNSSTSSRFKKKRPPDPDTSPHEVASDCRRRREESLFGTLQFKGAHYVVFLQP